MKNQTFPRLVWFRPFKISFVILRSQVAVEVQFTKGEGNIEIIHRCDPTVACCLFIMFKLPVEILIRVFSQLGSTSDILAAAHVCKDFHTASQEESLWQEMADRKYGHAVSTATLPLYNGSYRAMIQDDNKRGAFPTIHGLWKSEYKFNQNFYFFCCLITCIRWNRCTRELQLYLDVRGEEDLRQPWTSTIWIGDLALIQHPHVFRLRHQVQAIMEASCLSFQSSLMSEHPGHFKGVLTFHEDFFLTPNHYMFCYANANMNFSDYAHVKLFEIQPGQTLLHAWKSMPRFEYTTEAFSPFADDSPQTERDRWIPHLPEEVLDRPNWWVP